MNIQRFKKVCIIGAGVMGTGIAAQLANAGVSVILLDVKDRAKIALKNTLKRESEFFYTKKHSEFIHVGNIEDDFLKIKECDWVIEAVVENLEIKQDIYEKLEYLTNSEAIISSNSSGCLLSDMSNGRSSSFKQRFLLTHFFNPVRYLSLLEVVLLPETDLEIVKRIVLFCKFFLGKNVVFAKDTPNFIANRIGIFSTIKTIEWMDVYNLEIAEIDAIFGSAMGRPKSAIFRTIDLIGLDTFLLVAKKCFPKFKFPIFFELMLERGWVGQKSGHGFYKKDGEEILVLDPKKMQYKPKSEVRFDSLIAAQTLNTVSEKIAYITSSEDNAGLIAWNVTAELCVYSATCLTEIADDITQIDNALKWGFGFEKGPFEIWDAIGIFESIKKMQKQGLIVPSWVVEMLNSGRNSFYEYGNYWNPKTNSIILNSDLKIYPRSDFNKNANNVVKNTEATRLLDLGDGILVCEFKTKMNTIDNNVLTDINASVDICESGKFNALIIANCGLNFSAGANLLLLYMNAMQGQWNEINTSIRLFQETCLRLKYSNIPTIAAPFHLALGGGAEISLWCNRICSYAELYIGLVESSVGLIPAGGGNVEMIARTLLNSVDSSEFIPDLMLNRIFEIIAKSKISKNAFDAQNMLFLNSNDNIVFNKQHLLMEAKQVAISMAQYGFTPPMRRTFRLPGSNYYSIIDVLLKTLKNGCMISDHDVKIGQKIAYVISGGNTNMRLPVSEQYLFDLEREAFMSLIGEQKTLDRIAYMLEKNKALRN